MKYLALGAAVAVLIASAVFLLRPDNDVRSPREVMGAFVYHIDRGNFGKACGLMSDEFRGDLESCSQSFVFNAGMQMGMAGVDVFDGASLLPGVEEMTDGRSYEYRIRTDAIPEPVTVLVQRQENGRYRIARID